MITITLEPTIEQLDEAYNNYVYQVPEDKEKMMYDFYALTILYGSVTDETPATGTAFNPRSTLEDENFIYHDVLHGCLVDLREELINAGIWALACEFKYIYKTQEGISVAPLRAFFKGIGALDLFLAYSDTWQNKNQPEEKLDDMNFDYFDSPNDTMSELTIPIYSSARESYKQAYKAVKDTGISRSRFAKIAADTYNTLHFADQYGGPAWGAIAEGISRLINAKSDGHMIAAIDHVFDLQHNTGSVFTKLTAYYDANGSYKWIARGLDKKRDSQSVHELVPYMSAGLKGFLQKELKRQGYDTFEEWDAKSNFSKSDKPEDYGIVKLYDTTLDEIKKYYPWLLKATFTGASIATVGMALPHQEHLKLSDKKIKRVPVIYNAIWESGDFLEGEFRDGTWNNGTFNYGRFSDSTWNNGVFMNGTFLSSTWEDGSFYHGTMMSSTWKGGCWYRGTFDSVGKWESTTQANPNSDDFRLPETETPRVIARRDEAVSGIENALETGKGMKRKDIDYIVAHPSSSALIKIATAYTAYGIVIPKKLVTLMSTDTTLLNQKTLINKMIDRYAGKVKSYTALTALLVGNKGKQFMEYVTTLIREGGEVTEELFDAYWSGQSKIEKSIVIDTFQSSKNGFPDFWDDMVSDDNDTKFIMLGYKIENGTPVTKEELLTLKGKGSWDDMLIALSNKDIAIPDGVVSELYREHQSRAFMTHIINKDPMNLTDELVKITKSSPVLVQTYIYAMINKGQQLPDWATESLSSNNKNILIRSLEDGSKYPDAFFKPSFYKSLSSDTLVLLLRYALSHDGKYDIDSIIEKILKDKSIDPSACIELCITFGHPMPQALLDTAKSETQAALQGSYMLLRRNRPIPKEYIEAFAEDPRFGIQFIKVCIAAGRKTFSSAVLRGIATRESYSTQLIKILNDNDIPTPKELNKFIYSSGELTDTLISQIKNNNITRDAVNEFASYDDKTNLLIHIVTAGLPLPNVLLAHVKDINSAGAVAMYMIDKNRNVPRLLLDVISKDPTILQHIVKAMRDRGIGMDGSS